MPWPDGIWTETSGSCEASRPPLNGSIVFPRRFDGIIVAFVCCRKLSHLVIPHRLNRCGWASNLGPERSVMPNKALSLVLLSVASATLLAQEAAVTPLMSKDLSDMPGKELSMITVEYAPGGSDPVHRHNAHAFIYVLEGSIVMQVKGGEQVTLTPGQTFYEGPDDVHVVGRNASSTAPAKFVVFFVKAKGAPILVPAK